jgi:hypothetical protein
MSILNLKVPALVTCLMRLHNFYSDKESRHTARPLVTDEHRIHIVARQQGLASAVNMNEVGSPSDL